MKNEFVHDRRFDLRTLNYLGSKLRLLDFIEGQVSQVTESGAGVCDLFAGSGCVSYRLSERFSVTSCDIQFYSKVICDALLRNACIPDETINRFLASLPQSRSLSDLEEVFGPLVQIESAAIREKNTEVLADIIEHGSLEVFQREKPSTSISKAQEQVAANLRAAGIGSNEAFIARHYGGVYFSYEQSIQIDSILSELGNCFENGTASVFRAALLSTASDVVDTVGKHFAQPIRARDSAGSVKPLVYNKAAKDKTLDLFPLFGEWVRKYTSLPKGPNPCKTIQGDFKDCLAMLTDDVQTVYADPPYTRDHYSRFYHVLETIARGDCPDISMVRTNGKEHVSNGLYRKDRHQSPFCIKSTAPGAFADLFHAVAIAHRNLLLSYSPYDKTKKTHPRVVTMDQLVSLARSHFKTVEVVSAGKFAHNKLNSSGNLLESSDEAELLIVCKGP